MSDSASQDRFLQRTREQTLDLDVPLRPVEEEVSSQDDAKGRLYPGQGDEVGHTGAYQRKYR